MSTVALMERLLLVTVSASSSLDCMYVNPLPSPTVLYSTAITCPAVAAPSNGSIDFGAASPDGNSSYAFDVVANYYCNTGFSLVGNSSRTCTGDGSSTTGAFDGGAPTCERKCNLLLLDILTPLPLHPLTSHNLPWCAHAKQRQY